MNKYSIIQKDSYMNESTSNFEYALSEYRARCNYSKFPKAWKETSSQLEWYYSKSGLPWSQYDGDVYLFVCEKVPGSDERRFISCKPVNATEMKKAYTSLGQVLESWFGDKPMSQVFNECFLDNRPWVNDIKHSKQIRPLFIQPTVGGSVSGNGSMPLGEELTERLELAYRGEWFTPLWVWMYEEHKGESILVDIDPDIEEYHTTFELHSATRVSSFSTVYEDAHKHVIEISGHNLSEIAKLFDALAKCGNGGHSFSYKLNDKKLYFDGDGSDYIYRVKLLTETK